MCDFLAFVATSRYHIVVHNRTNVSWALAGMWTHMWGLCQEKNDSKSEIFASFSSTLKKLYRRGVAHAGHWNGCEWRQSVFRYNTEIFRSILRVFRCFWEDFSSKSCPSGKISRLADFQAAENVLMPHQKNDPPCFGHFSRTVQALVRLGNQRYWADLFCTRSSEFPKKG